MGERSKDSRKTKLTSSISSFKSLNTFANDGSFLEMFKKKMESTQVNVVKQEEKSNTEAQPNSIPRVTTHVFKRKPKVLKTGMVKKPKLEDSGSEDSSKSNDAWTRYQEEVKKYKQHSGEDEEHRTRALVK